MRKPAACLLFVPLAFTLIVASLVAEAQQAGKMYRIAFYSDAAQIGPLLPKYLDAFRQGLREHGWLEGQNVVVDFRESRTVEQRSETVAALLQAKPDVIVAMDGAIGVIHPSPRKPIAGWSPVRDIPIVFTGLSDPVGMGLVQNLARPGGHMTGLSYVGIELNVKRLALLKELLPRLARVVVLVPSDHLLRDKMVADIDAAARGLGISLQRVEVASTDPAEKIDTAIEAALRQRPQAMLGLQGAHYYRERNRICDLTLRHRLPGAFELAEYADAGCLMAYATSYTDLVRRAAGYVDRILKGAKPGDLPVEQPTKFELVINMRTAKALGLTIPQSLLLRADQVIE